MDVVRVAAEKRRKVLQAERPANGDEDWKKRYEELEAAIGTLLDPKRKAAYDRGLRGQPLPIELAAKLHRQVDNQAVSGLLRCPRCSTSHPAAERFCGNCGESLWGVCPSCGKSSPAGRRFCGACGADLAAAEAERVDQCKAALREAERLRTETQYDAAILALQPLAETDDPVQQAFSGKANELIAQLAAERDRRRDEGEAAHEEARRRFAAHDYVGARQILEGVPETLRSDAATGLLDRIANCQERIVTLSGQVEEAIRAKRWIGLLPKVDELLSLRPNHAPTRKLARQLQDRLCQAAEQRLARHEYDAALRLMEQIPAARRIPESERLFAKLAELAYLAWDLRNAPVVDRALLAVAQRMKELAPEGGTLGKQIEELRRRAELASDGSKRAAVPWVPPPDDPHLGTPIDRLTTLPKLEFAEKVDKSIFVKNPGRFAVACGLALQGIGKAPLMTNLLPDDDGRLLKKLARAFRGPTVRTAWGLDVGPSSLKAVKLSLDSQKGRVVIEDAAFVEHKMPLGHAGNEEEKAKLRQATLETFLEGRDLKGDRVCVGLAGRKVLGREVKLPAVAASKEAGLIRYEAQHQFPFHLDELVWDYRLFGGADNGTPETERPGIMVAAQRTQVTEHLAQFAARNVRVDVVQSDSLALHNFVVFNFLASPEKNTGDERPLLATVDFGSDGTNIVISSPTRVWFRVCGLGGDSLTRALVGEFNLTFSGAETLKRQAGATHLFKSYVATQPILENLVHELQTTLDLYSRTHRGASVDRVLGVGGGLQSHDLLRYLRSGR